MHKQSHASLLAVVILTAVLFRIRLLGWAPDLTLTLVLGLVAVAGLYALGRQLFNWQIGLMAGFLLAASLWHAGITDPNALIVLNTTTWGLYALWRGMATSRGFYFLTAGVLFGIGVLTHLVGGWILIALFPILLAYRSAMRAHFEREQYFHAHDRITRGLGIFLLAGIVVILPGIIKLYLADNGFLRVLEFVPPLGRAAEIIADNFLRLFSGFNGRAAFLFWPAAALAAAGLVRSIYKLVRSRRQEGHFSTAQVTILAWFFASIITTALGGAVTGRLMAGTAATLLAAEGLWRIYTWLETWYEQRDVHTLSLPGRHFRRISVHESTAAGALAITILLAAIAITQYFKI